MNRGNPPSQASAQAEAQLTVGGTTVRKPFCRMALPICMPATALPPELWRTTIASLISPVLCRNSITSMKSSSPVILMREGPEFEDTDICAGLAGQTNQRTLMKKITSLHTPDRAAKILTNRHPPRHQPP